MIRAEHHLPGCRARGVRGFWRIFAALLCFGMVMMSATASAQTPGDVNGDGVFNVTDVQCSVLIVLAFSPDEMPACAADAQLSDMNCDESTNVVDIQLLVMVILGSMVNEPGLPVSQDADLDSVHDACDICPEIANTVQVDTDSDGLGDACDLYPGTPAITGGCAEGATQTAGDGCNTCECASDHWVCTEMVCSSCPEPLDYEVNCIQMAVWAKDPTDGSCCAYSTPCAAPPGWQTFGNPDACGNAGLEPECSPGDETDDGCNICSCTEEGQWQCTMIYCPDDCTQHSDCDAGEICNEDGFCTFCAPGTSVPAGDGCNTCICMEEGGLACTKKGCPDACNDDSECDDGLGCSVDICNVPVCDWNDCEQGDENCVNECPSQGFCSHDMENCASLCEPGETQPADDGCNTCTCTEDGEWACTLIYCTDACENHSDCKEGEICNEEGVCALCEPGTVVDADDGCNTCICLEGGGLACTKKACPQTCSDSKDCNDGVECTTEYCAIPDCAPPELCPEGEECSFDCPTEGVCVVDHSSCGEGCTPGDTQDAEDGCNTCTCTDNGTWNCTKQFCPECEDGDTKDEDCNTCVCINQLWACTKKGCQCSDEANDCAANSTCFKGKCEPNPCLEVSDCAIGGPGCNLSDECYVPAWCGENDSMAAQYGGCDNACYGTCESSNEQSCYDETDPNVEYVGASTDICMVINYTCDFGGGWDYFSDDCGCGCIKTDTGCEDSLKTECTGAGGIWLESSCSCKGLDCDGNYVPDIHQFYGDGECHDGTNDAEPFNLNCEEHYFDCSENGTCDCQSVSECDDGESYGEGCSLFSCMNGQWQEAQISCGPGYVCGAGDCVYDPCYGKVCGDSCFACDPAEKDCVETNVEKSCDPEGQCVPDSDDLCDGGSNACGGFMGLMCEEGAYCQYEADTCFWSDNMGECTQIPLEGCPDIWEPVCACDGNTYGNLCEMQAAQQSLHYQGSCGSVECTDGDSYGQGCSTFICDKGVWQETIVDCLPGYTCNEGGCEPIACMGDDACPDGLSCDLENYCLSDPSCVDFGPCPDVCFGQCVLPEGDCEAGGEYYWAGEEYYEGCSIFQCGTDGQWYQAILDCLPGYICEEGSCVSEPQVCGDNSECTLSVYSEPVWNTDSCYCPMCPDTVLTQAEHNQRYADWQTHCAQWADKNPCPVPGCVYPGTAYCEFEPGVCNQEGGTGLCTLQPETDQCLEPLTDETVCGCDGSTYSSACVASTTGASVDYSGSCQAQPSACCMADIPETMCTHMTSDQCNAEGAVFVEGSECGEVDCASILQPDPDPCADKECGDVCATSNGMLDVMMYCQPDGSCGMNAAPECGSGSGTGSVGAQCGGIVGGSCDQGLFCEKPEDTCDFVDMAGVCVEVTEFCPEVYDPVCGCDGGTYSNDCFRRAAMVSLKHTGACGGGGGGGGGFEEGPDIPNK